MINLGFPGLLKLWRDHDQIVFSTNNKGIKKGPCRVEKSVYRQFRQRIGQNSLRIGTIINHSEKLFHLHLQKVDVYS